MRAGQNTRTCLCRSWKSAGEARRGQGLTMVLGGAGRARGTRLAASSQLSAARTVMRQKSPRKKHRENNLFPSSEYREIKRKGTFLVCTECEDAVRGAADMLIHPHTLTARAASAKREAARGGAGQGGAGCGVLRARIGEEGGNGRGFTSHSSVIGCLPLAPRLISNHPLTQTNS